MMWRLFLCVALGSACAADPPSEPTGFGGPGATCDGVRLCAEGLVCRGGLCMDKRTDAGSAPVDAGQVVDAGTVVPDAGLQEDAGRQEVFLNIVEPDGRTSVDEGEPARLVAEVRGDDLSALRVRWSTDRIGEIGIDTIPPTGRVIREAVLGANGVHRLVAELLDGDDVVAEDVVRIGVCGWTLLGDFERDIEGWQVYGSAARDDRGWLELTGNRQGRKGAIYQVSQTIEPGNVHLAFRVSTGNCDLPGPCNFDIGRGADGFAMNIWDVAGPDALQAIFDAAYSGGGLAYGVGGPYGDFARNAFHIEFDTWHNRFNGNNELHTDPTPENHVAVTLDGNPGNHIAFAAIPHIEDNNWHDIELVIEGNHVRVFLDELPVIDQRVEGLDFKGGYIGFSGTTGFYTNYHRFDDLRTQPSCTP